MPTASEPSGAIKVNSSRNPFCVRSSGRISFSIMRVNSGAELALSFIETWRANIFLLLRFLSCGFQVIWKIPEELRREQAGLGSTSPYANALYMSNAGYILYRE